MFKQQALVLGLDAKNQASLIKAITLGLIAFVAIASRLFSIIRFESVIHEFDPWFNYRATKYLVSTNFYEFWNWFDERSWYPLGRVVGGTVFPGLMVTSATIYNVLHSLNFPVDIRNICVLLAPLFSAFTAYAAYLLTAEIKDSSAGLLAAAFIGVVPGYISRSVAGSYDNEGIAIFLLMFTFYLWIKALKQGSAFWGALTAFFYFYMVAAWGGYVFIINLIPLHAFVLILMGRFSNRLYVAYSSFYVLGTLMSMQVPFVGFQPTFTSEHMAALGIFGLLQIIAFVELVRSHVPSDQFQILLKSFVVISFMIMLLGLVLLTLSGVIAPWTGRFYSLWDTGYAKKYIPIIASVSEHQPTAWPSFFFDLQLLVFLFPAGIYFCFRELKDEHVFVILYGITSSYFAGVMVRLMLTLAPIVCVTSAITISKLLDLYLDVGTLDDEDDADSNDKKATNSKSATDDKGKSFDKSGSGGGGSRNKPQEKKKSTGGGLKGIGDQFFGVLGLDTRIIVLSNVFFFLVLFTWHCTWVTSNAYSSPSIVLASRQADGSQVIIDDFREAYYWLRKNTDYSSKVMSWWDYGYQIAGMADRTVLVDNNTWNNTHIATVGKAMSSNEEVAYEIMRRHDVDYVLVIFGGLLGYSGDDINKFLWMIRIAEGVYPKDVKESLFFNSRGEYRVDDEATPTMRNSIMYKMSYHNYNELFGGQGGHDRVRNSRLPSGKIVLNTLEEAYTTENWIVRIYKVKDLDIIGRSLEDATNFEMGKKKRRQDCYWALLSRKDFSFLYLSPWLSNNLKNESSDLLLGTSLFDYFRPDEKMLAQKDLTRVNNNKLSLSITSTTALDLSSSTNVDEYIVMDIGISLVSRVHNGDKCSCGESFEFTQKTIDELNKCLNNKNSSSPNGPAIKFTTPPSTPHSEKFFSGNNPLFPPPPPSDRIFQIFDRKSKDLILTWPNPAISFTDNSNNTAYYNKNDFSKLILDCVNNDNKINNYNNYNTPNCLKATVHDKRLLLLSSSGSYGHVESLIIPYGNIIFASFQILSNTINPSSSKLSLTNNNNIGNGNFSESTPCSPTSTLKLTTPVCMTAVTGSSGDDYRSSNKRPRSLSPLLSIINDGDGDGSGNNTYPSPKSHNNNLPFISHNPSSSISSPQQSHSLAQNNNHHINHQYQQSLKNNNGLKECESCHTNTSPEWRRGPTGHKTLCNACGLRYSRTIARENRKKEQAHSEEEMRKREQRERDDMAPTVTDKSFILNKPPPAPYANIVDRPIAAALKLKDGQIFQGVSFGAQTPVSGEAVFTTSLVGYPESMTDPSYRGQILVFTQPLIGNYGVPGIFKDQYGLLKYFESDRIQCKAIVVNDYAERYSHWTAVESLGEWCARHGVPAISGVDTRAIVHILRNKGSTLAKLVVGEDANTHNFSKIDYEDPNKKNLVQEVSTEIPVSYNPFGDIKIAVIDCGIKTNILRCLVEKGVSVTVLPWDFDFNKISNQFDGIFISNGPGDPTKVLKTVENLRIALDTYKKPIFGICMGNLLLGMAAGLPVYKLRFGNRGHNVPALNVRTNKCIITSQNHGYALDDKILPQGWEKYFVNVNDGSNEGIRHVSKPMRSVQFHPEACGGPQDSSYLFDEFVDQVRSYKLKNEGVKTFIDTEIRKQPVLTS
ncbi:4945_t:CDS:10 [Entrophospora sp. SA101]|nr:4945_t:CDS:10 [Entrophospora sp. SA101]